jgi:hypothetical protein
MKHRSALLYYQQFLQLISAQTDYERQIGGSDLTVLNYLLKDILLLDSDILHQSNCNGEFSIGSVQTYGNSDERYRHINWGCIDVGKARFDGSVLYWGDWGPFQKANNFRRHNLDYRRYRTYDCWISAIPEEEAKL